MQFQGHTKTNKIPTKRHPKEANCSFPHDVSHLQATLAGGGNGFSARLRPGKATPKHPRATRETYGKKNEENNPSNMGKQQKWGKQQNMGKWARRDLFFCLLGDDSILVICGFVSSQRGCTLSMVSKKQHFVQPRNWEQIGNMKHLREGYVEPLKVSWRQSLHCMQWNWDRMMSIWFKHVFCFILLSGQPEGSSTLPLVSMDKTKLPFLRQNEKPRSCICLSLWIPAYQKAENSPKWEPLVEELKWSEEGNNKSL